MNHQTAIEAQFPERYVFGDLSDKERGAFEDHMADCSHCLEQVRTTESFSANVYGVFQDRAVAEVAPLKVNRKNRWSFLNPKLLAVSGGMNLAFAAAAAYVFISVLTPLQNDVTRLRKPSIAEVFTVQGITRSATSVYTVRRGVIPHFRMDLPQRFASYSCDVTSASTAGLRRQFRFQISSSTETLDLAIPLADLPAGYYHVQLGGNGSSGRQTLATFTIRLMDGS
jgi:Putative zinc-finger